MPWPKTTFSLFLSARKPLNSKTICSHNFNAGGRCRTRPSFHEFGYQCNRGGPTAKPHTGRPTNYSSRHVHLIRKPKPILLKFIFINNNVHTIGTNTRLVTVVVLSKKFFKKTKKQSALITTLSISITIYNVLQFIHLYFFIQKYENNGLSGSHVQATEPVFQILISNGTNNSNKTPFFLFYTQLVLLGVRNRAEANVPFMS